MTPAGSSRNWSLLAGLGLILLGAFALLGQFVPIDWGHYAWPLFILVPGLVLAGAGWRGQHGVLVAGFVVTTVGLILLVQNLTGFFASWAYAWALIPTSVGIALWLQGRRGGREDLVSAARWMLTIWPLAFLAGFVFFELVLGIDGFRSEVVSRFALPALLIAAGSVLLARNLLRARIQE
jgi:hypothetical protein